MKFIVLFLAVIAASAAFGQNTTSSQPIVVDGIVTCRGVLTTGEEPVNGKCGGQTQKQGQVNNNTNQQQLPQNTSTPPTANRSVSTSQAVISGLQNALQNMITGLQNPNQSGADDGIDSPDDEQIEDSIPDASSTDSPMTNYAEPSAPETSSSSVHNLLDTLDTGSDNQSSNSPQDLLNALDTPNTGGNSTNTSQIAQGTDVHGLLDALSGDANVPQKPSADDISVTSKLANMTPDEIKQMETEEKNAVVSAGPESAPEKGFPSINAPSSEGALSESDKELGKDVAHDVGDKVEENVLGIELPSGSNIAATVSNKIGEATSNDVFAKTIPGLIQSDVFGAFLGGAGILTDSETTAKSSVDYPNPVNTSYYQILNVVRVASGTKSSFGDQNLTQACNRFATTYAQTRFSLNATQQGQMQVVSQYCNGQTQ